MKVLWLCNVMLPVIAAQLGQPVSSKEGWVSGMADTVLADQSRNNIALSVAFPMQSVVPGARSFSGKKPSSGAKFFLGARSFSGKTSSPGEKSSSGAKPFPGEKSSPGAKPSSGEKHSLEGADLQGGTSQREEICQGTVEAGNASLDYYGFPEDLIHPEKYDETLEPILKKIVDIVKPDIVHCFGTEYPHTLAMCRVFPDKSRILVGLQGLCSLLAQAYYANLPRETVDSVTFRDWLKKDSIRQQQHKFVLRGEMEQAAVGLAGNITGRTRWDRANAERWNPSACYYAMNESLRREFYGPVWEEDKCIPHSIFISQGDYPLKGFHYMLLALPIILARYPDAAVYVAGNSLVEYKTLKQKIKISAYGKYLRKLLRRLHIEEKVVFLGMLSAAQMRDRCLKSSVFVCCSSLENSPNSLGEAMLLGMPCVSADVGGIPSMFAGDADGILYDGFRMEKAGDADKAGRLRTEPDGTDRIGTGAGESKNGEDDGYAAELTRISCNLAEAVIRIWSNPEKRKKYCTNARVHALSTHDREKNYRRLVEIYGKIL